MVKKNPLFISKVCFFCKEKIEKIDYKDESMLSKYISYAGKIASRKRTGTCMKHQRKLSRAIKRSRIIGLLPFTRKG